MNHAIEGTDDADISEIKSIRVAQQEINDRINDLHLLQPVSSRELELARQAGQTVRHWLGESLGVIREHRPDLKHPYPEADNPATSAIAPTADTTTP